MIKNIVFDVGNVLLGYRWKEMLMDDHGLMEEKAEQVGQAVFDNPLWNEFDLGNITITDMTKKLCELNPQHAEDIQWFLTHTELMPVKRPDVWKRIPLLKNKGYQIYLLSNYSEELFHSHTKNADFLEEIHGKLVSYEINVTKPDDKIYETLFHKYQLKAEECLFFDDRLENIETAKKLGMQGILVISEKQLLQELDQLVK